MQSQLTIRLPNRLASDVATLAKRLHLKRSDVVRIALEKIVEEFHVEEGGKPYEKVKDLLGSISSNIPDLGEAHRRHLLGKFKKNA